MAILVQLQSSPKQVVLMRLLKSAFQEHHGHEVNTELEQQILEKAEEAEKKWLMEIILLAILFFLVAFSQGNSRHEGEDEGDSENVKNDQEEAEARTLNMGILATILNLMTYSNAHYGHLAEEGRKRTGSKDIPEEEKKKKLKKKRTKVKNGGES